MAVHGSGKNDAWNRRDRGGLRGTATGRGVWSADNRRSIPDPGAVTDSERRQAASLIGIQNVASRIERVLGRRAPGSGSRGVDVLAIGRHPPLHTNTGTDVR